MAIMIQNTFNAGELSPTLDKRVDQERYKAGCLTALNGILLPQGPFTRRPGSEYIGETGNSDNRVVLVPFSFNTEQSYMLEFGIDPTCHGYMRVFKGGVNYGQVVSGPSAYEISTPYGDEDELFELRFVQSADVMYICHPNYAPRKLSRTGHTAWTLTVVDFGPALDAPTGLSVTPQGSSGSTTYRYKVSALSDSDEESEGSSSTETTTGNATLSASNYNRVTWTAVTGATGYRIYREKDGNGIYGFIGLASSNQYDDKGSDDPDTADTPQENRDPFVSADNYPTCVAFYEQRTMWAGTNDDPQKIWGSQSANYENLSVSSPLKDDDGLAYTIAADRVNQIYWMVPLKKLLIGTAGGEWRMSGPGDDPLTPLEVDVKRETVHGSANVQPVVVGSTLVFLQRPGRKLREFKYSLEIDGYGSSDLSVLSEHMTEDTTIVQMAYQQEPHSIIWCVRSDGVLLALTYMREHEVVGWSRCVTSGYVESVATIPGEGDEDELWLVVRRSIKRSGWNCTLAGDGKAGDTFTLPSGQTFESGCIVEGVDLDGLQCWYLYSGSQSITACSGDVTVTLDATPTGSEVEHVYDACDTLNSAQWTKLATPYVDKRYVERLSATFKGDVPDGAFFVDSGLTQNTPYVISDASQQNPVKITTATAHGFSNGDTVRIVDVEGMTELNRRRFTVGNATSTTFTLTGEDGTSHTRYSSGGNVRKCFSVISGLDHQEGLSVDVLTDGAVHPARTVTNGQITLNSSYAHVHVGLGFTTDLKPMHPSIPSEDGSTLTRTKRISHVWVSLYRSLGLQVGPDEDTLSEVYFRDSMVPYDTPPDLFTGDKEVEFDGDFETAGDILVRQEEPLPMTVLAVSYQIQVGAR